MKQRVVVFFTFVLTTGIARAGTDREIGFDQSGIWARKYQTGLQFGVIAAEIGGALWLGNDDELGVKHLADHLHPEDHPSIRSRPTSGIARMPTIDWFAQSDGRGQ